MIFVSYWFIIFAAVFFPLFWLARTPRLRLLVLLVGCATFHTHFAGPAGVLPIICLAIVTYLVALTRHPVLCSLGITVCALALIFYKYTHFLTDKVVALIAPDAGAALLTSVSPALPAAPPLAISFF